MLLRIELGGAYISQVRRSSTNRDVARQATDLVAGVTRWRRYLDFLLAAYYSGNLKKVEPRLKQILRMAIYGCFVAQKAPHVAVDRAVQLAKSTVRPDAGRLVNGILRAMLRTALPQPDTGDLADDLAVRYSHPTWMVRRWLVRLGPGSTRAFLMHNNSRPWYGLRCNTLVGTLPALRACLTRLDVGWKTSAYLADFIRVAQTGPIQRAGLLSEGVCAVQDEGAGLVVRLLNPQPSELVLDLCAAPGGKATYAALRMKNRGELVAIDQHANRLRLVARAARAQQITIIRTHVADARAAALPRADRVLVDAPCTGTGVLAKRADLRWRRTPEDLSRLMRVQDELLDAAARCVKPGGVLVYSTCSIETEENEARIGAFCDRHANFALEPASGQLPGKVVSSDGYLRTMPPGHMADGTFAARLRRT